MRRDLIYLLIAIASVPALYYGIYPFTDAAAQARNMRKAEAFIPTVRQAIAADPRFGRVELQPFTARLGSLAVSGAVAPGALTDLKRCVEQTSPPVEVIWMVSEDSEWQRPTATTAAAH